MQKFMPKRDPFIYFPIVKLETEKLDFIPSPGENELRVCLSFDAFQRNINMRI